MTWWCVTVVLGVVGCGQQPREKASRIAERPEPVGEPLPDLLLPRVGEGGGGIQLSALRGKVVLLDFRATWASSEPGSVEALGELQRDLGGEGFSVLGMTVRRGAKEGSVNGDVLYPLVWADDEVLAACGGVRALPTRILLDTEGRVLQRYEGHVPMAQVRADVEKALAL
jgi:cytochrome c biogenesis protein CcmG/thiol:disulfide interchange protein DsbE